MKKVLLTIVAAICFLGVSGQEKVTKANYALAERFSAKKVNQMVFSTRVMPNWFRDGDRFWYEWKTPQGTSYYLVDPAKGTRSEIFDMEKLAMQVTEQVRYPFDAAHIPMRNLKLKEDRYFHFDIVSGLNKDKDTTYFRYDIVTHKLDTVGKEKKKYPMWASVSPDGKVGVFAKGSNLWIMDSTNLRKAAVNEKDTTLVEYKLTTDGIRQFGYGYGNYTGDTEKDSTKRHNPGHIVWSPDSRHFATMKWDMRKLSDLWVINSVKGKRPELETYKYQMPGEAGPKGYLLMFTLDGLKATSKEIKSQAFKDQEVNFLNAKHLAKDNYLDYRTSKWLGDDSGFYLVRQSRDLKRLDLCWVGVGADSTKTIISERERTYIEYRNPVLVKGGRQLIWWSERNGWANLYLYDSDGNLQRALTDGAFHVEDVLGVNEKEGYVLLSACGVLKDENPYQMHTFRVPLAGGNLSHLDMDDMDVLSTASDDARYFVANYSRVDCGPAVALYEASGKKVMDLGTADLSLLLEAGYKFPERFKVKAADGVTDLYGAMYKPYDFDSTKVYPICDYVYPGPQVEANNISWSKGFTRTDRLAQLGIIVITVGNRGGHPNRSKWYHNYGYGNLRDYGLEDQKYAIQQLGARYPFIDLERVGIHGHSGGGFMSTAAILKYPDFFKAAVSCAGNHDNSIYNRWWSEQHHGILEKVDKGDTTFVYSISTNQELAKNLKGHLMLVHGDIDNNVHPANTIRVVNALIRANKRFDMLILPGQRHGFGDMN
ncbi:MAG: DPP IV N-terminal domain-containing protein, partial [Bacteroidales bacterium]|nr:DPP IV N-terminal domain-containing protein [Bacteroidales bacterium]